VHPTFFFTTHKGHPRAFVVGSLQGKQSNVKRTDESLKLYRFKKELKFSWLLFNCGPVNNFIIMDHEAFY